MPLRSGTLDHWHKTITLEAVAAGKDIFVEKPVSHTIEEGAETMKAIEASKQILHTATAAAKLGSLGPRKTDCRLGLARPDYVRPELYWYGTRDRRNLPARRHGEAGLETVVG